MAFVEGGNLPLRDHNFIEEKLRKIGKYAKKVVEESVDEKDPQVLIEGFVKFWNKKRKQIAEENNSAFVPVQLTNDEIEELVLDLRTAINEVRRGPVEFKDKKLKAPGDRGAFPKRS